MAEMTPEQLNVRAKELESLSRYDEAEALYRQSLASAEATLGPNHPSLVFTLNDLAQLLFVLSRYDDAEALLQRSLAITESFNPNHENVARALGNLARLLDHESRYAEAEPLYRRSLATFEAACGPDDLAVAVTLHNLAKLLADQGRHDEAETLYRRALEIKKTTYGPNHLEVASALLHLAAILQLQNRFDEAVPVLQRCLEIKQAAYGPDHPEVAHIVKLLGASLEFLGRSAEANAVKVTASSPGMLRRENGKKYLDIDGAHAVVHACSTVENYLDRYVSGTSVYAGKPDELKWSKDGRLAAHERQECCYCGTTLRLRPRFPNTSARVRCSRCMRGQEFYVVQTTAGLEQALGYPGRIGWGYTTIWLTVPLTHPEFSALLQSHGVRTWRVPRGLKRIGTQFQNTWQDILWFEGTTKTLWWPRYREIFDGVEIQVEA